MNIQTRYEHEDDTEDIPDGVDPIEIAQMPYKNQ